MNLYYSRKRNGRFVFHLFLLLSVLFLFFTGIKQISDKIMPTALAISHYQAKNKANVVIDTAVDKSIQELGIHSADFFLDTTAGIGNVAANTMLINSLCVKISENIQNEIIKISDETIEIPVGALTGIQMFANTGPAITFTVRPMGEALTDYETSFQAVGINQTNFKIWLNIQVGIQIVNPLKSEKLMLSRKIMLIDTVIKGEVPERYLEFGY